MLYTELNIGDKTYKLRLSTKNIITLEKLIGCNPLSVFKTDGTLPEVTTMVNILYCSLIQLNHGISLNDAYNIFDEYLANGNSMTDFISVILDIYRSSGLIPNDENEKEKNATVGE